MGLSRRRRASTADAGPGACGPAQLQLLQCLASVLHYVCCNTSQFKPIRAHSRSQSEQQGGGWSLHRLLIQGREGDGRALRAAAAAPPGPPPPSHPPTDAPQQLNQGCGQPGEQPSDQKVCWRQAGLVELCSRATEQSTPLASDAPSSMRSSRASPALDRGPGSATQLGLRPTGRGLRVGCQFSCGLPVVSLTRQRLRRRGQGEAPSTTSSNEPSPLDQPASRGFKTSFYIQMEAVDGAGGRERAG